jgi:hypothetical protein
METLLFLLLVPLLSIFRCRPERSEGPAFYFRTAAFIGTRSRPADGAMGVSARRRTRSLETIAAHANSIKTISGLVPTRIGGPHVPAPVVVYTHILPNCFNPYV